MRLIHLAHYPAPYPGSFVPMLSAALGAARRRGWETAALFGTDSRGQGWLGELERNGVPVRLVDLDSAGLRRELSRLLAAEAEPTILHTHFTAFDVPAALAARRHRQAAVVWHLHSPARTDLHGRLRGLVKLGLVGRLADRILCVAPDLAGAATARGAPADRVRFFPNAIDAAVFSRAGDLEREAARSRLGLPADGIVLLHFGWDWQRKGGDVFLRAVRALRDMGRPVSALTVGGGFEAERLVRRLALQDAVVVSPFGERVQALYAAGDVFVTPSRAEGMPFSMLEALASGLPVAASSIPGQAALAHGLGACRLTSLEPDDVARAVASLLDRDVDTVDRDAAEAARRVRDEYDLVPWAERLLGVYDELGPELATSPR
jgi:glycosyltransferase involved in cell wall biosynthesis